MTPVCHTRRWRRRFTSAGTIAKLPLFKGPMHLGIDDFQYSDLYDFSRLTELATAFDRFVGDNDAVLFGRFDSYCGAVRSGIGHGGLTEPEESELLISVARHLGAFLAQLFRTDPTPLKARTQRDSVVARFKKEFVSKRVAKVAPHPVPLPAGGERVISILSGGMDHDHEYAFAVAATRLLDLEREYPRGAKEISPNPQTRAAVAQLREALGQRREKIDSPEALLREAAAIHAIVDVLIEWTAARWESGAFDGWPSFRLPKPVGYDRLVPS